MQTNAFSPCSKTLCIKVTCSFAQTKWNRGNYLENSLNSHFHFDYSDVGFNCVYTVLPVQTLVLNWPINKISKLVRLIHTFHPHSPLTPTQSARPPIPLTICLHECIGLATWSAITEPWSFFYFCDYQFLFLILLPVLDCAPFDG